jgi:hypothetical protein
MTSGTSARAIRRTTANVSRVARVVAPVQDAQAHVRPRPWRDGPPGAGADQGGDVGVGESMGGTGDGVDERGEVGGHSALSNTARRTVEGR